MKQVLFVAAALILGGCGREQPTPADFLGASPAPTILSDLPPQVRSFIEQKEQQVLTLAKKLQVEPDGATLKYFRQEYDAHVTGDGCPAGTCKTRDEVTV